MALSPEQTCQDLPQVSQWTRQRHAETCPSGHLPSARPSSYCGKGCQQSPRTPAPCISPLSVLPEVDTAWLALVESGMRFRRTSAMIKLLSLVAKVGPRQAAWLLDTFEEKYGHFLSSQMRLPVSAAGEPLPWYTYPSIEYLQQLDFSARHVFEFGAGNGSQFWAQRAKSVTSVEHDPEWFGIVEQRKRPNQTLLLHQNLETYALAIATFARNFD